MDYYNEMKEAVIKQLDMSKEDTEQTFRDVATGGADGGFSGFIYYSETVKFAKDNMNTIYEHLKSQAEDFGINPFEIVQSFRCLKDVKPTTAEISEVIHGWNPILRHSEGVDTQIMNALSWYALEEVAFNEAET